MPRKRSRRQRNRKAAAKDPGPTLVREYYHEAFAKLHDQMTESSYFSVIPPIRRSFWGDHAPGEYAAEDAQPLLFSYLRVLEDKIAEKLQQGSVAYFLHLYRRLSPGPIGDERDATTILLTRAALEAAVQKYAGSAPCRHVGISTEVREAEILNGMLMKSEHERLRHELGKRSQLVLTAFDFRDLRQFYFLERLAHEVWRTMAMLRTVGKGADLVITADGNVRDDRSEELRLRLEILDKRDSEAVSLKGLPRTLDREGLLLVPAYNTARFRSDEASLSRIFAAFSMKVPDAFTPNFLWLPFDFRGYWRAHGPFSEAFEERNEVRLDAVLAVIGAALADALRQMTRGPRVLVQLLQRGYLGPTNAQSYKDGLCGMFDFACRLLGVNPSVSETELGDAFDFLRLNPQVKAQIDLGLAGPHSLFLPFADDAIFVDYAWVHRRLWSLFYGVDLGGGEQYKGAALEELVRIRTSVLPSEACRHDDGSSRQIDAAFLAADTLVVVECKTISWSLGYERGDVAAVEFRRDKMKDALDQAANKAQWLAERPIGRNYDISAARRILPIVVSPFAEFIWSSEPGLWMTRSMARIVTPSEIEDVMKVAPSIPDDHSAIALVG